jgi:hypothetical protein
VKAMSRAILTTAAALPYYIQGASLPAVMKQHLLDNFTAEELALPPTPPTSAWDGYEQIR